MNRLIKVSKKIFLNKAILYVISRYATYIIQFINSLFIAIYLGPFYLGIWGFIILILGYARQLNFGVSSSVNVFVSIHIKDEKYVSRIVGNGISMLFLLSLLIVTFFFINYLGVIKIGEKYSFNTYALIICVIAVIEHFNTLLTYIIRAYGKLFAIAVNQSLFPILIFFLIPFFRSKDLLWAMVIANLISTFISFILLIIQSPVKLRPLFEWTLIKKIQKKGWYLFIYASSFHFIMISTNSFISGNYKVEQFGLFTFSYSLSNVILLLLTSIANLISPKVLNRFSTYSNEKIINILDEIRTAYMSLAHALIHFVIMAFPLFLFFFKSYQSAGNVFNVTALTVVLNSNLFGYTTLLIARGKEKKISSYSLIALLINVSIAFILVYWLKVPFYYVMFATMIAYLFFVLLIGLEGRKELLLPYTVIETIKDVFPLKIFIPFSVSILLIFISVPDIYFIIPFILYIILNKDDLLKIKNIVFYIIKKPDFINI